MRPFRISLMTGIVFFCFGMPAHAQTTQGWNEPGFAQAPQAQSPLSTGCARTPVYRLTGAGMEWIGNQCQDVPGEGNLEAISPRSFVDPAMTIEVSPSITIIVPKRQPGLRVLRVGAGP